MSKCNVQMSTYQRFAETFPTICYFCWLGCYMHRHKRPVLLKVSSACTRESLLVCPIFSHSAYSKICHMQPRGPDPQTLVCFFLMYCKSCRVTFLNIGELSWASPGKSNCCVHTFFLRATGNRGEAEWITSGYCCRIFSVMQNDGTSWAPAQLRSKNKHCVSEPHHTWMSPAFTPENNQGLHFTLVISLTNLNRT